MDIFVCSFESLKILENMILYMGIDRIYSCRVDSDIKLDGLFIRRVE